MSSLTNTATTPVARERKQRVALHSLIAAIVLLTLKIIVGLATRSLGILAEAGHSGLDLLATIMTFASVRIAERPADEDHPFGHGKIENFSAFLQTGLLLVTAGLIIYAALRRWVLAGSVPHITASAFGVMLASIAVDIWRSRALSRAAHEYRSDALEADALNFSSDLWSSTAVLCGLALAWVGERTGNTWLRNADSVAAIGVAAIMLLLAWRLGRRTAGVLLDEAPVGLLSDLREGVLSIPGVVDCERLRLRRVGHRYYVDVRVAVERTITLERAAQVRDEVSSYIRGFLPDSDVIVETHPREPATVNVFEQIKAVVQRNNLTIHDLSVYEIGGGLDVELHLEVDESLSLKQAHDLVTAIETQMRAEIPGIRQVVTHIEPELGGISSADLVEPERLSKGVQRLAQSIDGVLDCHDVQIKRSGGHLSLTCHCSFPDTMQVARVHELVTRLEAGLKREFPELFKVTIHTEPGSDNRR